MTCVFFVLFECLYKPHEKRVMDWKKKKFLYDLCGISLLIIRFDESNVEKK